MKNLQVCLDFYKNYGAPMIHQCFGEYEGRIAAGVVGEGSDCFGFDDYISADHDYGPGFCMWLTDEDYQNIGAELQESYEKLLNSFLAGQNDCGDVSGQNLFIDGRRGVFRITDFYKQLIGVELKGNLLSAQQWLAVSEDKLATAVNGQVYRDDLGTFTAIRNYLVDYYPDAVWKQRLAVELYHFSQNAQSNYARMMVRRDYVTSNICVQQAVKSTMALVYLLNRKYAPYYKWMRKGMDTLPVLPELGAILDAMAQVGCQSGAWEGKKYNPYEVNMADPLVKAFEMIASMILAEMNRQGIVEGDNPFLDIYSKQLLAENQICP